MNQEKGNDEKRKVLIGKRPPPEAKSWHEYSWKMLQEAPDRVEDAAKFIATMISVTLTIFFASFKRLQSTLTDHTWLVIALGCWIMALFLGFFVLFPKKPAKKMSYIAGLPKPAGCV